jgi:hypothetical protein
MVKTSAETILRSVNGQVLLPQPLGVLPNMVDLPEAIDDVACLLALLVGVPVQQVISDS